MVTDEHVRANLRVGLMLEVLDKLAEETALRYVRQFETDARVVTAAMDDLEVRNAPDSEQDILLHARINYVGKTSMEVGIRIEQDDLQKRHIASCYFTMVARKEGQSLLVRPLEYVTEQEKRRSRRGAQRRFERLRNSAVAPLTIEEHALLHDLHRELDTSAISPLLARNLVTSGWERTYPEYENVPQTIFGGHVIHHAYMYAHICAEMIADHRALLVSSNRIDFYQPVRMGDKLHFVSQVTYTGQTSLTVETSITRVSRDRLMTALSNNCIFTFVNVDAELKRMPVPRVYPASYTEDERYLAAYRRHQKRKNS
jgi:acyl-coenzyme A thioesterase 9